MKIERKDIANSQVELIVEESLENLAKIRKTVLKEIKQNADIKGFRKGANIPEDILVKEFGEDTINGMVIEKAIDKMYRESLQKEKIMPVAQGEISEIISESPLKIKMVVEILPEAEISDEYKKISLKKKKISVTDKEVKAALAEIEKKFTKFEEVTDKRSKTKMGDRVTIDTQGFDDKGKELENTNMQDYPLVLGSNILVPGFEEQMVGHKLEDEMELPIEFPKDYHNTDFAGKKTTFTVTIKKFEKAIAPEFTEEFIEQLRGKKLDFEGFKALIKEEIADTKKSNAQIDEEKELIEELIKVSKVEIGPKLTEQQIGIIFNEVKENMAQSGVKMEDYLEGLKLSEADYKEQHLKETAITRLKGELILAKLAVLEKVEVTDEELNKEVAKIMDQYGSEEVKKRLTEIYVPGNKHYEELRQRLRYRAIIDTFFTKK